MNRALQLAHLGLGKSRPNPSVGAVIVYNDKIIGEGYTSPYGGPHAEVNAIHSVTDKGLLKHSTIYVTLEPCCHYGKTPPCADLILKYEIPRVVIGCVDTNHKVSGGGIKRLKDGGCKVVIGVLETRCKRQLQRFFCFHEKKRPYIILKWAETQNGLISPKTKETNRPVWITDTFSRQLVHKWRAEEQAILVGTKTVTADNPFLNLRDWSGQDPLKIVIDKNLSLNLSSNIFKSKTKCIRFHSNQIASTNKSNTVIDEAIYWDTPEFVAQQICSKLHQHNITSVIIEGGQKTLQSFIDANLWDEARVFKSQVHFKNGIKAPLITKKHQSKKRLKDDDLLIYFNFK